MSKPEESSLATDSVFSGQFPFHVFYGVFWFSVICFWALRFCVFLSVRWTMPVVSINFVPGCGFAFFGFVLLSLELV
jgi:hypothetical protein